MTPACPVCFTVSWDPCPEDTPRAVPDPVTGGWMVCGMCELLRVTTLALREASLEAAVTKALDEADIPKVDDRGKALSLDSRLRVLVAQRDSLLAVVEREIEDRLSDGSAHTTLEG